MGRGRAKAKQTKVARELKYHSPSMDLDALQRELSANRKSDDYDDEYGEYRDEYDEYYEDDEAGSGRSRSRRR